MINRKAVAFAMCTCILLISSPGTNAADLQYQVTLHNTTNSALNSVPVTFAHPFRRGDFPVGESIAVVPLGSGDAMVAQVDKKSTFDDGSVRHAIVSMIVPTIGANQSLVLELRPGEGGEVEGAVTLGDLIVSGQSVVVDLKIGEQTFRADLADALSNPIMMWLEGQIASEWVTSVPFRRTSDQQAHSDLRSRFYVRKYAGLDNVKVDVVVENLTTFEGIRQRFDYAAEIRVNGAIVYSKDDITHFRNSRWKYSFWTKGEPPIHVAFNPSTLMATRAVPAYDARLLGVMANQPSYSGYTGSQYIDHGDGHMIDRYGPMGRGGVSVYHMGTTGARNEIAPLPGWTANWLLVQTPSAKFAMMRNSDLAGSWSIHYRDENTGLPVTIDPAFGGYPAWGLGPGSPDPTPVSAASGSGSPMTPDTAHQPQFSFVPYLVSGDFFHYEELEFWAAWNLAETNPGIVAPPDAASGDGYRNLHKGYITNRGQLRARAWNLRTLAMVAAFTPDNYATKPYWRQILENNLERYYSRYVTQNNYGYGNSGEATRPWMDDYMTWAIVYTLGLGYEAIRPTAEWKVLFPVARMGKGAVPSNWCWQAAADYEFGTRTDSLYPTINDWWAAWQPAAQSKSCGSQAMADALGLDGPSDMRGRQDSPNGYVSQFGMALAAAVDMDAEGARDAWDIYIGVTGERGTFPDFRGNPRFAIVPHSYQPELGSNPKAPVLRVD